MKLFAKIQRSFQGSTLLCLATATAACSYTVMFTPVLYEAQLISPSEPGRASFIESISQKIRCWVNPSSCQADPPAASQIKVNNAGAGGMKGDPKAATPRAAESMAESSEGSADSSEASEESSSSSSSEGCGKIPDVCDDGYCDAMVCSWESKHPGQDSSVFQQQCEDHVESRDCEKGECIDDCIENDCAGLTGLEYTQCQAGCMEHCDSVLDPCNRDPADVCKKECSGSDHAGCAACLKEVDELCNPPDCLTACKRKCFIPGVGCDRDCSAQCSDEDEWDCEFCYHKARSACRQLCGSGVDRVTCYEDCINNPENCQDECDGSSESSESSDGSSDESSDGPCEDGEEGFDCDGYCCPEGGSCETDKKDPSNGLVCYFCDEGMYVCGDVCCGNDEGCKNGQCDGCKEGRVACGDGCCQEGQSCQVDGFSGTETCIGCTVDQTECGDGCCDEGESCFTRGESSNESSDDNSFESVDDGICM